jgi:hypothetical protein
MALSRRLADNAAGRALDPDGNLTVGTGVASNGFGLIVFSSDTRIEIETMPFRLTLNLVLPRTDRLEVDLPSDSAKPDLRFDWLMHRLHAIRLFSPLCRRSNVGSY